MATAPVPTIVPAPATNPADRDPATIASTATYAPNAPVWIYRSGAWRPGIVLASSERAALIEYRYAGNLATGTDTAIAPDLAARDEHDPHLDLAPPATCRRGRRSPATNATRAVNCHDNPRTRTAPSYLVADGMALPAFLDTLNQPRKEGQFL